MGQVYNNGCYQPTLLLNTTLTRCHCPSLTPPEMKLFTWLVLDDNEPFSLPKDTVNTTCPSSNSNAIKSFSLLYLPLYRRTALAMYVLNSRLIVIFQRRFRPEVNAKKSLIDYNKHHVTFAPVGTYLLKGNNGKTGAMCKSVQS